MEYVYDESHAGSRVNAYVFDTGVSPDHPDLEGRVEFGADFTRSESGEEDVQGHGTHVAGLIGSRTFGVAKDVTIVSVKVLDDAGTGTLSSVIEGIEFAVNHMRQERKLGVGNLSLGAAKNSVLNDAVKALHSAGLVMVVLAGNSGVNACSDSPLSSPYLITVGALDDRSDEIAPFSNWGECVDIFASGVYVESLYHQNYASSILMSGTSMSSPIVAGIVVLLLDAGCSASTVAKQLLQSSTPEKMPPMGLATRPGTANKIAFFNATR